MQRATAVRRRGRCARRAPRARRPSPTGRSPSGCRAWRRAQPAPAAISAAVVETLNVGRPPPVPAVSTQVVALGAHRRRERAHRPREAGELVDGLALRAQRDQERRDLRLGRVAGHDLGEHRGGLLGGEVAGPRPPRRSPRSGRRHLAQGSSRSSCLPRSVSTDSGWNCTPSAGSSRWRMPITTPPPCAVDLEAVRAASGVDDERVVAPDGQRARQAREDRPAVVLDRRRLAVHRLVADDAPAEGLGERLVAEADAERRHAGLGEAAHDLERDPGLVGRARARARRRRGRAALEQLVDASRGRCARPRARRRARPGTGRGCR